MSALPPFADSSWTYPEVALWLVRFAARARFRHPEEDHDPFSAAPSRERFVGNAEATIYILPIIRDPNVARRSDGKIGLHLQTSADIAAGRRNLIAGLKPRRTVLGAHTA